MFSTPRTTDTATGTTDRRGRLRLGVVIVAVLVRGGFLWGEGTTRLEADPDSYRRLALNVRQHGTFGDPETENGSGQDVRVRPTAYRPPLYPLILAAAVRGNQLTPLAVALLHVLLGVLTVDLVFQLGQAWHSAGAGAIAALLTACDPILLNQSAVVMTETLATFLAALALYCLTHWGRRPSYFLAILSGSALALTALCRPTFFLWLGAVLAMLLVTARSRRTRSETLVCLFTVVVILSPWATRNWLVFGRPILATTHSGYTLWLANNEDWYRYLGEPHGTDVWDSRDLDDRYRQVRAALQNELQEDRWARQQALATIREHPGTFLYACLVRVGSLWGLVPHRLSPDESRARSLSRYAVGVWYAVLFGLALWGLGCVGVQLRSRPWLWGVLLVLTFTAVHTVYWTNLRMRAPLMPLVGIASAVGLLRLRRIPQPEASRERPQPRHRR
jgi:4-amino-4-deoxy-L-arabinose transferase-like glycosyltransferase